MSSVAVVGGGVVGERVRRNLAGNFRVVPRDLAAEIVVLASPGPHVRAAEALLSPRCPRRFDEWRLPTTFGSCSTSRPLPGSTDRRSSSARRCPLAWLACWLGTS